ncbi:hypothetical protein SAMN05192569_1002129 [Parageobacillus thermantarcticus]|uniref:Uncharacterized protein n=1 Tax=Parageobacillus thermantarcticus TaxID=186116 RepID=A0A1I0SMF1_9BACL|nr:hypothetical protein SAMN05192569_1002129 [Parageobacillus thermantarcticus]
MNRSDGMNYAPKGVVKRAVVEAGVFRFADIGLDHGHIYGMCSGLIEAGGELVALYDPDPKKCSSLLRKILKQKQLRRRRRF